jgi:hypothetical protein
VTIQAPPRRKGSREDQALLEKWLNQELDRHEQEIGAERQSVTEAEYETWLAKNPKRHALHRATEEQNFEPMKKLVQELVRKKLGDEFARVVRLPKSSGKDPKPRLEAKTHAVWEARRAQAFMQREDFIRYEPRTYWKVAALRAGLTVDDVMNFKCRADPWPVIIPPKV